MVMVAVDGNGVALRGEQGLGIRGVKPQLERQFAVNTLQLKICHFPVAILTRKSSPNPEMVTDKDGYE
jgi:hypothetical protein